MFVYFYMVNCSCKNCKHFYLSRVRGCTVQFCYFFCSRGLGPIPVVLVRSAQTAHVVYTLCAELFSGAK